MFRCAGAPEGVPTLRYPARTALIYFRGRCVSSRRSSKESRAQDVLGRRLSTGETHSPRAGDHLRGTCPRPSDSRRRSCGGVRHGCLPLGARNPLAPGRGSRRTCAHARATRKLAAAIARKRGNPNREWRGGYGPSRVDSGRKTARRRNVAEELLETQRTTRPQTRGEATAVI